MIAASFKAFRRSQYWNWKHMQSLRPEKMCCWLLGFNISMSLSIHYSLSSLQALFSSSDCVREHLLRIYPISEWPLEINKNGNMPLCPCVLVWCCKHCILLQCFPGLPAKTSRYGPLHGMPYLEPPFSCMYTKASFISNNRHQSLRIISSWPTFKNPIRLLRRKEKLLARYFFKFFNISIHCRY